MDARIEQKLKAVESSEEVKILYACESGSRAWGFASSDSDYDVRFLYVRPEEWYLSIDLERKRDVIELPIEDSLDIKGWDIRKTLTLLQKSNPPLLEWLGSPIVYSEVRSVTERLRELAEVCFSPTSCMYHYLRMAEGNYRNYLTGERIIHKKYFYVLRPLLAVQWMEKGKGRVPTEFAVLAEQMIEDAQLKSAIQDLIEEKQKGVEIDEGPRIPVISDFIEAELGRLSETDFQVEERSRNTEALNEFFRSTLRELWEGGFS